MTTPRELFPGATYSPLLFLHLRLWTSHLMPGLSQVGGVTVCFIEENDGALSCGLAVCSPEHTFSRKLGESRDEGPPNEYDPTIQQDARQTQEFLMKFL